MYKTNVTTEYREQLKGRILQSAMHEFRANGIKQVKWMISPENCVFPSVHYTRFMEIKRTF